MRAVLILRPHPPTPSPLTHPPTPHTPIHHPQDCYSIIHSILVVLLILEFY
jgi:hypothetical protein